VRGGVDRGVGNDTTVPEKACVGGTTSVWGSKNEGRLAKGVCTGKGSGGVATTCSAV